MTDERRAHLQASIAARDQTLAELGVTLAEAALFNLVHYGLHNPPEFVVEDATKLDYNLEGPTNDPGGRLALEDCRLAMESCLAKGWLQVIDKAALSKILAELRRDGVLGPIHPPWLGGVDFTPAGAALWCRFRNADGPSASYSASTSAVVRSKTAWYFKTRSRALAFIEEVRGQGAVFAVAGPTTIGPWRAQWWRQPFPEGYRVDIEERKQGEWYCGSGDGVVLNDHGPEVAPESLLAVLERHGVTRGELLSLASLDSARPERLSQFFAGACSREQQLLGQEECMRSGWMRALDDDARAEVAALLLAEPAVLTVLGEESGDGEEFDYTPGGAALYRTIVADWLGPAWEDGLQVRKELYREEHHYAVVLEGLQNEAEQHAARGAVVRLVPIGPWCVTWWARHQAGYRLEVEVGRAPDETASEVRTG